MLFILDRDGVINKDFVNYVKSTDEWFPLPGALEAIAKLKKSGHTVVVATNQSGIARKVYTVEDLEKIHQLFASQLKALDVAVDGIYYCPHKPEDNCDCRKPKPGMFLQIKKDYPEFFSGKSENVWMIGDTMRDLHAAEAIGCKLVLAKTGKGEATLAENPDIEAKGIKVFEDLQSFVDWVLGS